MVKIIAGIFLLAFVFLIIKQIRRENKIEARKDKLTDLEYDSRAVELDEQIVEQSKEIDKRRKKLDSKKGK